MLSVKTCCAIIVITSWSEGDVYFITLRNTYAVLPTRWPFIAKYMMYK